MTLPLWFGWIGLVLLVIITLVACGVVLDIVYGRLQHRRNAKNGITEVTVNGLLFRDDLQEVISQLQEDAPEAVGVVNILIRKDDIKVTAAGVSVLEVPSILALAAENVLND